MTTFKVKSPVYFKGKHRKAEATFEADLAEVEDLVEAGKLVEAKASKATTPNTQKGAEDPNAGRSLEGKLYDEWTVKTLKPRLQELGVEKPEGRKEELFNQLEEQLEAAANAAPTPSEGDDNTYPTTSDANNEGD